MCSLSVAPLRQPVRSTVNLTVLGGTVTLADTFKLNGNLTYAGTVLNRAPGAQITGQINTNTNAPYFVFPSGTRIPMFNTNFNPFFRVGGYFLGLIPMGVGRHAGGDVPPQLI